MRRLREDGHDVLPVPTHGPGTAGGIAREAVAGGAVLIIVAGGDGTVNETLDGMVGSRVPLGVLPAGTANVLAMEIGVPVAPATAAARLADCVPCRISVGCVRYPDGAARHFLLMAGVGVDARVVYELSGPLKAKFGKLAYWIAGFKLVGRVFEEFQVRVDGRVHVCSFALVSKVRNYGGDLEIARNTSLFEDRFEIVLFAGRSALLYVKYLAAVLMKRVSGVRGVTVLRAREVALEEPAGERVYVQVDGEFAGRLPATIEIVPDALTLLVPPAYARRFRR